MSLKVKADFAALARKAEQIRTIRSTSPAIVAAAAQSVTDSARASFAAHQSPYGDAWAARRDGKPRTNFKSGALFSQLRFVPAGTAIRVSLGVPYARYRLGRGDLLPRKGAKLPPAWAAAIEKVATRELARRMGAR